MKLDENLTALQAHYKASDPLLSIYHPQRHFGSISEKIEQQLQDFIRKDISSVTYEKEGSRALKQKFPVI